MDKALLLKWGLLFTWFLFILTLLLIEMNIT